MYTFPSPVESCVPRRDSHSDIVSRRESVAPPPCVRTSFRTMRLPKYFQPVGTSKQRKLSFSATRSNAIDVGMLRATPCTTLRPNPMLAKTLSGNGYSPLWRHNAPSVHRGRTGWPSRLRR